jgi:mono/diheme cytochrome c family protein
MTQPLRIHAVVLALGLAAAVVGCRSEDSGDLMLYQKANATRGGAIYDRFWSVPGVRDVHEPGQGWVVPDGGTGAATPPTDGGSPLPPDNPLYVARAQNPLRGSDTWTCSECHGYDYKGASGVNATGEHRTGFPGVLGAAQKSVTDLAALLRTGGGLGAGHAFAPVLSDKDIADLVKFLREGVADTSPYIDNGTLRAVGDVGHGKSLFDSNCSTCHGADGRKINFKRGVYDSEYVYDTASLEPHVLFHRVRFGTPGSSMPTAIAKGYYLKDVADILAYVQTLSTPGLEGASILRGGALYDSWWLVSGAAEPAETNSLYTDPTYNTLGGTADGSDTWTCNECHGYDYRGRDGQFATGDHATGMRGLWESQKKSVAELVAAIGDGMLADGTKQAGHEFLQPGMLSEKDVKDLVLFIKQGLVDDYQYLSPVTFHPNANADPAVGKQIFSTICFACHGEDGRRVNFAHGDDIPAVEYVGRIARNEAPGLMHKIRYGRPASDAESPDLFAELGMRFGHMPNRFDLGITDQQAASVIAYAQTLPATDERGGELFDTWWNVSYVPYPIAPGVAPSAADGGVVPTAPRLLADNPFFVAGSTSPLRGPDTWRCSSCHGWDLGGANGFPGVLANASKGPAVYYATIANGQFSNDQGAQTRVEPTHAFLAYVGDAAVRDLVNFINDSFDYNVELVGGTEIPDGGAPDPNAVKVAFDPSTMVLRTRDANPVLGAAKFAGQCASCHGTDGRALNVREAQGQELYLGDDSRQDPRRVIHAVRSGVPGSKPRMPAAIAFGYTVDDFADLLVFLQQLP